MAAHVQKTGNRYKVSPLNHTNLKRKSRFITQTHEAALRVVNNLLERDDIGSVPIPPAAKRYARRSGLAAMKRQPFEFRRVNAQLTNPGKKDHFQNYDEVGKVKQAMKR